MFQPFKLKEGAMPKAGWASASAVLDLAIIGIMAAPHDAKAWWRGGYAGVYVPPPVVYAPPPHYVTGARGLGPSALGRP